MYWNCFSDVFCLREFFIIFTLKIEPKVVLTARFSEQTKFDVTYRMSTMTRTKFLILVFSYLSQLYIFKRFGCSITTDTRIRRLRGIEITGLTSPINSWPLIDHLLIVFVYPLSFIRKITLLLEFHSIPENFPVAHCAARVMNNQVGYHINNMISRSYHFEIYGKEIKVKFRISTPYFGFADDYTLRALRFVYEIPKKNTWSCVDCYRSLQCIRDVAARGARNDIEV